MNDSPRLRVTHDGFLGLFALDAEIGWQKLHVTLKRTFELAVGAPMQLTTRQYALCTRDHPFEDADPLSSAMGVAMRFESDIGPVKAKTDVVVHAQCYAPGGESTACQASVQVANEDPVTVKVVGDRVAVVVGEQVRFTGAKPFIVRPIRYEFAYGGVDKSTLPYVAEGAPGGYFCETNPVGTGYMVDLGDENPPGARWTSLPNIEHPDRPLLPESFLCATGATPEERPPAGFGWIPRTWKQRIQNNGFPEGMNSFWNLVFPGKKSVAGISKDRELAFWNGAPEALQVELEGFEKIVLTNLHHKHRELKLVLPILQPRLSVTVGEEKAVKLRPTLVTVQIEVERNEAILAWRATVERPEAEVEPETPPAVVITVDDLPLPPAHEMLDYPTKAPQIYQVPAPDEG